MKTIEVEFVLGDQVYYTFSPTKIIYGTVDKITKTSDGVGYSIKHNYENGGSECWNLYSGVKNVFGTVQEAKQACMKWAEKSLEVIY